MVTAAKVHLFHSNKKQQKEKLIIKSQKRKTGSSFKWKIISDKNTSYLRHTQTHDQKRGLYEPV